MPPGLVLAIVCGCLASLITFGLRSSFGLFTAPLSADHGWTRDVFALAMAIQNLLWGVGQPIAGALADRFGVARVLAGGGALYALGVALTPYSTTPLALHATAGVLVGLGMGGASTMIVLAAFGRLAPPEYRSWALGIGTAAGSLGQFLVVPLAQAFISAYGWHTALLLLAGLVGLVPLLAPGLRKDAPAAAAPAAARTSLHEALRGAFGHASYLLLVAGFFVCGFQLAFVTVHLPPYLTDAGASPSLAAWAIGTVGLFNVAGSYASGVLGGRYSKRLLLSAIYFGRAVTTALFLLVPITPASVLLFAATMGLLWLSTVPLTSGLVAVMFGTRYMATLFGLVFFSHQVGSFVGVWLGGTLFERTGSYEVVWWLSVALSLAAALVHLPIAERPARPALATAP
ncbi:MAG TPA: MFS transporter [Thermodesulfobacteriota bacterium]